ncbi:hypothetical protein JHK82_044923 [Glycine max]|nr:hypothetical protein JHK82_044923 [Glycine max]
MGAWVRFRERGSDWACNAWYYSPKRGGDVLLVGCRTHLIVGMKRAESDTSVPDAATKAEKFAQRERCGGENSWHGCEGHEDDVDEDGGDGGVIPVVVTAEDYQKC